MPTLYVSQQGAQVRKRDNQVLVTHEGKTLEEIPIEKLEQLVVMGRGVQVSTALLISLVERGVPISYTNQSGSRHYCNVAPAVSRFGELRTSQMFAIHTPERALELARAIVAAKLANQRSLLLLAGWTAAPPAVTQIEAALAGLAGAASVDIVRGYEGAAAAAYFGAWRATLPASWGFGGRAYYPPPDPVNAMLSFGYTLALNDVLSAVQLTGLDPYLGTFHVVEAGRPSLGLDLLEEFRPLLVDRLVLELIQGGKLGRGQFERPPGRPDAIYLGEEGRALFVDRYETLLASPVALPTGERTPWRRVLLLQAQAMARVFRGEQERYAGFTPAPPAGGRRRS